MLIARCRWRRGNALRRLQPTPRAAEETGMRAAASLLIGVAIAPALTGQASDRFAPVRAAMQRMVDSVGSPSVAVAIAKDGRIVFEEAIAWANRERRTGATVNTIYALASISRLLTVTGLMVLVERGGVDLDRPLNDYLGAAKIAGLAGNADSATVRRVLSHTADEEIARAHDGVWCASHIPIVLTWEGLKRHPSPILD